MDNKQKLIAVGMTLGAALVLVAVMRQPLETAPGRAVLVADRVADPPAPTPERAATPEPTPTPRSKRSKMDCLSIAKIGNKVIKSTGNYHYVAWYIEAVNDCDRAFNVTARVVFKDENGFKLDSGIERGRVPANGTAKIGDQAMLDSTTFDQWEKIAGSLQ